MKTVLAVQYYHYYNKPCHHNVCNRSDDGKSLAISDDWSSTGKRTLSQPATCNHLFCLLWSSPFMNWIFVRYINFTGHSSLTTHTYTNK